MDATSKVLVIGGGVVVAAGALDLAFLLSPLSSGIRVVIIALGAALISSGLRRAYRPHRPQQ